jgi:hypothetical protein
VAKATPVVDVRKGSTVVAVPNKVWITRLLGRADKVIE